jgi:Tfp pilus assembly protein PilN
MKYLINLFPKPEQNTSEKLIYFATHYLRYVLVITQFVAICVFFFRFKVDQEIVDLRDRLHQKESILSATDRLISRIQEIDSKMRNVKTIIKNQDLFKKQYTYFFSTIPNGVIISNLKINSKEVEIVGDSSTIDPIRNFHTKLTQDNVYQKVELLNIEKGDEGFTFNMKLSEYSDTTP